MEVLAENYVNFASKNVKTSIQAWPICIAPEFVDTNPVSEIKKWLSKRLLSKIELETGFEIFEMTVDFTVFDMKEGYKLTGMCNDESREKEHEISMILSKSSFKRNLGRMFEFYRYKKFTMCLEGLEYTYNIEELRKLVEKQLIENKLEKYKIDKKIFDFGEKYLTTDLIYTFILPNKANSKKLASDIEREWFYLAEKHFNEILDMKSEDTKIENGVGTMELYIGLAEKYWPEEDTPSNPMIEIRNIAKYRLNDKELQKLNDFLDNPFPETFTEKFGKYKIVFKRIYSPNLKTEINL